MHCASAAPHTNNKIQATPGFSLLPISQARPARFDLQGCGSVPALLWADQTSHSSGLALSACLGVKDIGKTCAGKLNARFGEGGQAKACPPFYNL